MIAVSDGIEPLKTVLALAAALEERDGLPITIVTGQDLIMMEQRFSRKDIKGEMKEEKGLRTLCVGDYIAIISFQELVRHGREALEGRGAICFDLELSLLEDARNIVNYNGSAFKNARITEQYFQLNIK